MSHEAPQTVWVLSEESPFTDPEASGGCVSGVYATAVAALYYLGTWEIGLEGLQEITWTPLGLSGYEGWGHGEAVYILRCYPIEHEAQLRADVAAHVQRHRLRPDDELALSPQGLAALLPRYTEGNNEP